MIIGVKMYGCKCDNCGKRWICDHYGWTAMTDQMSMEQAVEDDWHTEGKKHFCTDCFAGFDDNDEMILNKIEI
jgi:hypothetical protein